MFKQPLGVQPGHSIVRRYYTELARALIKRLSCYASPNIAQCILQTLREQSSLCSLITPNHQIQT